MTEHAPVNSTVLLAPVHHTSATGPEPVPAATQSNSHITSPQGTKDLRRSVDAHTRDSGRGQAAQQHNIGKYQQSNTESTLTACYDCFSLLLINVATLRSAPPVVPLKGYFFLAATWWNSVTFGSGPLLPAHNYLL